MTAATTRQLLDRYHQAMINTSADELADLYAADAVHEFGFFNPAGIQRLDGREQVRAYYRRAWARPPLRLTKITNLAVHPAGESDTVIAEWVAEARPVGDGAPFSLAGVNVLTSRGRELIMVRDYMDLLGVAAGTTGQEGISALLSGA
jgi:ketosteroid isomerase-like protein